MKDIMAFSRDGKTPSAMMVTGLRASSSALAAARIAAESRQPVLCVLPSETEAARLEQDLGFFTDLPVFLYPGYDIPPTRRSLRNRPLSRAV